MAKQDDAAHTGSSQVRSPCPTVADLEQELWSKRLYDPEVWNSLNAQRESMRFWTTPTVMGVAGIVFSTAWLSLAVHLAFIVPGIVLLLLALSRRRGQYAAASRQIEDLTCPPGVAFPPVAVSKIISEGCARSPEIERYMRRLSGAGRWRITAFENRMFCRMLSAMDEQEKRADRA